MPAPTAGQLAWALGRLEAWHHRVGEPALRARLPTMMVLRYLGATTINVAAFDGAMITQATKDLFGIADSPAELTETSDHYFFSPFDGEYKRKTWPTGTMYTRLGTGSYENWLVTGTDGARRTCRFRADYLPKVTRKLGSARIPAVPLAVFIFRRPSVLSVSEALLTGPAAYAEQLRAKLSFGLDEFNAMFETSSDGFPG